ncbi:uncharacterized protein KY384_005106 [Bacidia gigantensis]|uniref:uncharacterized protein n=1 Tax=Bacidia gigantensis TaxID=2732470 RepID=UPI001D04F7D9|nr:uncharacterized protein KY384_005106 [Bacidia gigantensis]KAG8529626.1 hypothetical protein KY384_005106 [Bacidia gigantensis]
MQQDLHDWHSENVVRLHISCDLADMADSTQNDCNGSELHFFKDKTVFLTGATGNLGGCLLFKLTVVLQVSKIYILCRGSAAEARSKLKKNMPKQLKSILARKSVVFVVGDVMKPNFGICGKDLARMEEEVNIVINSAADISLRASLESAIPKNCMPPLELARMATRFRRLKLFVQISTAYCNAHLPDGIVEERIYPLDDPEKELETFQRTGTNAQASRFPGGYYYSKHLMERLLTTRHPDLPVLLVRPSIIGEAVHQPYEFYGPLGSCPITTFLGFYMYEPGNATWYVRRDSGRISGTNILDIVPVDWVANLVLLHTVDNKRGVIHASAESYGLLTFDELIARVQDPNQEECRAARFFKIATRDWRFSNKASTHLKSNEGPLSIKNDNHDIIEQLVPTMTRVTILVKRAKRIARWRNLVKGKIGQPLRLISGQRAVLKSAGYSSQSSSTGAESDVVDMAQKAEMSVVIVK